ncbi:MAG: hypothetical protein QOK10_1513 [Pseudonocardiales bacterium]|jgi:hypothetical protein|nr:hypothetical protein [Pseudonocardiales bacterium]
MSIAVAVAAGVASAVAYGAGTAGQHAAAYCGEADVRRLVVLLRNPRWLIATAGDVLGIVLQVIALASGPVVLVQPLLVLALPVAVVLRSAFGSPPPSRGDLYNCALVILALGGFFALLGEPARGHIIGVRAAGLTWSAAVIVGVLAIAAARSARPVRRAVVFGAVAGCWFGVVSVLIEAVSSVWSARGIEGFTDGHGLVPLLGVVVLGVGGYLLVQVGFQLGPLGASFPANLILDPVVAVLLGASLLNERVPLGGAKVIGYLLCLLVLGWAAVRLAEPPRPRVIASATMKP